MQPEFKNFVNTLLKKGIKTGKLLSSIADISSANVPFENYQFLMMRDNLPLLLELIESAESCDREGRRCNSIMRYDLRPLNADSFRQLYSAIMINGWVSVFPTSLGLNPENPQYNRYATALYLASKVAISIRNRMELVDKVVNSERNPYSTKDPEANLRKKEEDFYDEKALLLDSRLLISAKYNETDSRNNWATSLILGKAVQFLETGDGKTESDITDTEIFRDFLEQNPDIKKIVEEENARIYVYTPKSKPVPVASTEGDSALDVESDEEEASVPVAGGAGGPLPIRHQRHRVSKGRTSIVPAFTEEGRATIVVPTPPPAKTLTPIDISVKEESAAASKSESMISDAASLIDRPKHQRHRMLKDSIAMRSPIVPAVTAAAKLTLPAIRPRVAPSPEEVAASARNASAAAASLIDRPRHQRHRMLKDSIAMRSPIVPAFTEEDVARMFVPAVTAAAKLTLPAIRPRVAPSPEEVTASARNASAAALKKSPKEKSKD